MKKIYLLLIALCLVACTTKKTEDVAIELQPNKGEVVGITLNEVNQMVEDEDSFVVIFSQTYCGSCMSFFSQTDEYTTEVGLTLYDVTLDKEERSETENLELMEKHFSGFQTTPTIYVVSKGEIVGTLDSSKEEPTLDAYKTLLKESGVIK